MDRKHPASRHNRRSFLLGAGAVFIAACTDAETSEPIDTTEQASTTTSSSSTTTVADSPTTESGVFDEDNISGSVQPLTPAMFEALPVCTLTESAAAGPFPTNSPLDRQDIHEGYPGHPLRLGIRVVDQDCTPIPGARVEIWHTDATGDYSEYEDGGDGKDEADGSTFCRGIQTAGADGILEFLTIYPGWYPGRAVHVHAKVHVDSETVLTAQLYFDQAYTEAVYATGEYAQFGLPDTTWASDRIAGNPITDGSIVHVSETETAIGSGSLGLANVGVRA